MNTTSLEGQWDQMKGKVQEKFGKLTNDDLTVIEGKKDALIGKLEERYGYTAERAQKEAGEFLDKMEGVVDNLKESYEEVKDQVEKYTKTATDCVKKYPVQSFLAAIGLGLIVGKIFK